MRVNTLFQRQSSAALGVNYTGYDGGNSDAGKGWGKSDPGKGSWNGKSDFFKGWGKPDKGKGDGKQGLYGKGKSHGKGCKSYGSSSWSGGKSGKGGGKDAGKGFGKQSGKFGGKSGGKHKSATPDGSFQGYCGSCWE